MGDTYVKIINIFFNNIELNTNVKSHTLKMFW